MTASLKVEHAGPASTLQDGGRFGFLSRGVAPAGAFDPLLHAVANRLAGNPPDTAAVEFLMRGDTWRIEAESCRVAVTGDFAVQVDGEKAASWRTYTLHRGQKIAIGAASVGARGYLAVGGGFAIEQVLGSLSTHVRTSIGPFGGCLLSAGMNLPLALESAPRRIDLLFNSRAIPKCEGAIRIILGPQDHYFEREAIDALTSCEFKLTPECDRMGYQLRGPDMRYRKDIPLISEGVALGSIQVLEGGLFILNLVDRQTVGGYPKIATVIGSDVRRLAQMRPGSTVRFSCIDVGQAHDAWRAQLRLVGELAAAFIPADPADLSSEYMLSHNLISGMVFHRGDPG